MLHPTLGRPVAPGAPHIVAGAWLAVLASAPGWAFAETAVPPASPGADTRPIETSLTPSDAEVPRVLSLDAALALTARYNPSLRASAWNVERTDGVAENAGRRPNPELLAEAENFAWDLGAESAEWTLALSQTFELGGDRSARASATQEEGRAARHAFANDRLEAMERTAESFLAAWSAQERRARLLQAEALAVEVVAAAAERHREGAAPEVDRLRAEVNVGLLLAARRRWEAEVAEGRRRLAQQWGQSTAAFDSLYLDPPPTAPTMPAESLLARVPWHPTLRRAEAESLAAAARLREAEAARVPDVQLGFGYRRLAEADANTLVAAVSLPLPLWNGGGGLVRAAQATLAGVQAQQVRSRVALEGATRDAADRLDAALDARASIEDIVLPAARRSLIELQSGYRAGRFGILDLLAGQRTALDAEISAIEAGREVWSAHLAVQRLALDLAANESETGGTP